MPQMPQTAVVEVQSDSVIVGLNIPPPTGVTLRLWAPDIEFTPSVLTFGPSQTIQECVFIASAIGTKVNLNSR